ncbi:MAG: tandem-95 repeat protein [Verrucomicrobiales bacterium]|nr:tandem-95 repeat protein [Verrucomicrobiales bacterium]
MAQGVRLAWDPNPEPDIAGYKVYRGSASRAYTSVDEVGNVTSFDPAGLSTGVTYYFAVTAVNLQGMESPFSDEVSVTPSNDPLPTNHPPSATPMALNVTEDGYLFVTLLGTDPDDDPLIFTVTKAPSYGTLAGSGQDRSYIPDANFNGTDSIEFTVSDGTFTSPAAAVLITVTAVNDAPTVSGSSVNLPANVASAILLNAADVDGDPLTVTYPVLPTKGVITGVPPLIVYTPLLNASGSDSFQFRASDGVLSSGSATVSITIVSTNTAPVPTSESIALSEDTATSLVLKATDANGDPLTFSISQSPTNGTVSGTPPNIVYRPNTNFTGSDSIRFTASDGRVTSSPGTISLTVTSVNDRPTATPKSVTLAEDNSTSIILSGSDVEGSALTYAIYRAPTKGALTGTPPNLTYTPSANYNGSDSFEFTVSDGSLTSLAALVSITITAVNDVPTATPSSLSVSEDGSLAVSLAGSDIEGSTLSYQLSQSPTNGTLSGSAPNFTYRPRTNFSGPDAIRFTVSDGVATSAVATVSITVNAVNDPPVAIASSRTVAEDSLLSVTLTGSDPESSTLAFIVTQSPTNGTLSGTAPNLTYRPRTNFFGSDTLLFKVSDGSLTSAVATVSLAVTAVNDRPVATPSSKTLNEDASVAVTLAGTDVEGSTLSYAISSPPANGALSGTPPNLTYTPSQDFDGTDTFEFTASDGQLTSLPALVTLNVTAINDPPIATSTSVSVSEDTSLIVALAGSDPDGDALIYRVTQAPTNGTLSGTAPNLTYFPSAGFNGSDTIRFTVSDGAITSAVATVSITVTPVNDAPTASPASLSVAEDGILLVTLAGTDSDDDTLSFAISQAPTNGTLTGTAPNLTYRPRTNFAGADAIKFRVSDGALTSSVATISITVSPVNDTPRATPASLALDEDAFLPVVLAGTDAEGSPLTFVVSTPPANGTLSGTPPNITYTPSPNFNGTDDFEFTSSDGSATSAPATITLTVRPLNDPPTANSANRSVAENSSVTIDLTGSDIDGDALAYSIVQAPTNGVLSGAAPNLTYRPNTNFVGVDSLRFKVSDGAATSSVATVSITVSEVNQAPSAIARSVSVAEDGSIAITLTATDPDGDTLTFAVSRAPTRGTLTGTAPNLTYRPSANLSGSDSFRFTASDGRLTSAEATVSITITAVNDRPVATGASKSLNEDASVSITLTGSDVEGSPLSYAIAAAPSNGALTGTPPNLTYTPAANFNGNDSFSFTVSDGSLTSTAASVAITVNPVNDPPTAAAASRSVAEDSTITIDLAGSDIDGDTLAFLLIQSTTNGVLSGSAPSFTYRPNTNFYGSDALRFAVSDGVSTSAVATVSINVTAVNDPPLASTGSVSVAEDGSTAVVLSGSDPDGGTLTYTITQSPTNGTLTGTAPNLTYRPRTNFFGADAIKFRVGDGALTSAVATVTLSVTAVNDRPIAAAATKSLAEDSSIAITLAGSDVEGSTLAYAISTPPAFGALTGTPPNLTYVPSANFNGADDFEFTVSDGQLTSTPALVTLNVAAVNDPPLAADATRSTAENQDVAIDLVGTDIDGDPLTYSLVQAPTNGTLSGTAPNLIYQPAPDFNGTDGLRFTVSDGQATSAVANVSITVTSVNHPPVASNATVTVAEDGSLAITLGGSDPDGDSIQFAITRSATNGTLSGTAPNLAYRPNTNFFGSDSLRFTVNDGTYTSTEATVSITVTAVNDRPVAASSSKTVAEDASLALTLSASDVESSPLTYAITTAPTKGTLSGTPPSLTYRPGTNYSGADSFQFTASDGSLTSLVATISLTVTPVNDPPKANASTKSGPEDANLALALSASDPDGDALTYLVTQSPTNGTLSGTAPNLTYVPSPNFAGNDVVRFAVSDGRSTSSVAAISITITPVNDTPTANSTAVSTVADTPAAFNLTGSDIDGEALTFIITQAPTNGVVTGTSPSFTYTPKPGYSGLDALKFRARDAISTSAVATITFTISSNNSPLLTSPDAILVADASATGTLISGASSVLDNDAGVPSNTTVLLAQPPLYGDLQLQPDGTFTYRNFGGQEDTDSFAYQAISGSRTSQVTTVSLNIHRIHELRATSSAVELDFTVTSGLAYYVEAQTGGGSPTWETLTSFTANASGLATFSDPTSVPMSERTYRIRSTGTFGTVVSEAWGFRRLTLANGSVHEVALFDGKRKRRAKITEIGVDWIRVEGTGWNSHELAPIQIFTSHRLLVVQAANAAAVGQALPIVDNDQTRIITGGDGNGLAALLQPGDTVEISRLPSILDLFGRQPPPSNFLSAGDYWTVTNPSDGFTWNLIQVGVGDPRPSGLYADVDIMEFGPLLPSDVSFAPGQTISVVRSNPLGLPAVAVGRARP